jgi:hypothetical protein
MSDRSIDNMLRHAQVVADRDATYGQYRRDAGAVADRHSEKERIYGLALHDQRSQNCAEGRRIDTEYRERRFGGRGVHR